MGLRGVFCFSEAKDPGRACSQYCMHTGIVVSLICPNVALARDLRVHILDV